MRFPAAAGPGRDLPSAAYLLRFRHVARGPGGVNRLYDPRPLQLFRRWLRQHGSVEAIVELLYAPDILPCLRIRRHAPETVHGPFPGVIGGERKRRLNGGGLVLI